MDKEILLGIDIWLYYAGWMAGGMFISLTRGIKWYYHIPIALGIYFLGIIIFYLLKKMWKIATKTEKY